MSGESYGVFLPLIEAELIQCLVCSLSGMSSMGSQSSTWSAHVSWTSERFVSLTVPPALRCCWLCPQRMASSTEAGGESSGPRGRRGRRQRMQEEAKARRKKGPVWSKSDPAEVILRSVRCRFRHRCRYCAPLTLCLKASPALPPVRQYLRSAVFFPLKHRDSTEFSLNASKMDPMI